GRGTCLDKTAPESRVILVGSMSDNTVPHLPVRGPGLRETFQVETCDNPILLPVRLPGSRPNGSAETPLPFHAQMELGNLASRRPDEHLRPRPHGSSCDPPFQGRAKGSRSEEHTSELQ